MTKTMTPAELDKKRRAALERAGRHQDAVGYLPCLACGEATLGATCNDDDDCADASAEECA